MKKQDEIYVVKHNDFINARYKFSVSEQRVFLKVISSLDSIKDKDFQDHTFLITDLLKDAKIQNKTAYKIFREAAFALKKKDVLLKLRDKVEHYTSIFLSVTADENDGKISVILDPKLKPYFLQLQNNFTQYKLAYTLSLRSGYSIRLYEILKQYETIKERKIKLHELKEFLGIEGDKYREYGNFKKIILKRACKEISQHTDLDVEFVEKKGGRYVDEIIFSIASQEPKEPLLPLEPQGLKMDSSILELYEHVDEKTAGEIEKNYSLEYIKANINHAKKYHKESKGTLGGFIISCINEDSAGYEKKKVIEQKRNAEEKLKIEKEKERLLAQQKQEEEDQKILNNLSDKEFQALYNKAKEKVLSQPGSNFMSPNMLDVMIRFEMVNLKKKK